MSELAIEKVLPFFADAQELFPLQYEELGLNKDRITKLSPDLGRYQEIEEKGMLLIVTAREEGIIVGYFISLLIPHLHYMHMGLMAYTDMYYILPEFRKGLGAKLLLFVEEEWKKRGIVKAYISCKVHADHSALFHALGWNPSDYVFTKMVS